MHNVIHYLKPRGMAVMATAHHYLRKPIVLYLIAPSLPLLLDRKASHT